jgi:hypothetical protein
LATYYSNQVRGQYGKGPIAGGTQSMLDNAIGHCKQFTGGSFSHQNLGNVNNVIQCGIFCTGENIAKFSGPSYDPAQKCVEMWKNSPGHLANMLNSNDMTVTGVYKQGDWTYCTQTFALNGYGQGSKSGPRCNRI